MKIAILSAGPSLAKTWQGGKYSATILVNNAAVTAKERAGEVWFCCGDLTWAEKALEKIPEPIRRWCAASDVLSHFPGGPTERAVPWESLGLNGGAYSVVAALRLALGLGASSIDLYGCDWSGTVDCAGADEPWCRQDIRWEREQRLVEAEVWACFNAGCGVRRIMP